MKKNIILIGLLVVLVIAGVFAYLYTLGIPYPFCRYRTNVIESIDTLPPEDELTSYFQSSGWDIKIDDFEKQPKSLPHKEHILEAQTDVSGLFSKPHVTVYVAVMNPDFDVDYEGQVQIFVEQGNRIVNRNTYENFIAGLNQEFDLDISSDGFNYMSFCN